MNTIPRDTAIEICNTIRMEKVTRWYSWFFTACWYCTALGEGDPEKMTLASQPGYCGCAAVNARYEEKLRLN